MVLGLHLRSPPILPVIWPGRIERALPELPQSYRSLNPTVASPLAGGLYSANTSFHEMSQLRNSRNTHEEHVPARMTPANSSAGGISTSQMVETRRDNNEEVPVESSLMAMLYNLALSLISKVILGSNVSSVQKHSIVCAVYVYIRESVGGTQAVQATLQQWSLHFWLCISPVTARFNTTTLSCGAML